MESPAPSCVRAALAAPGVLITRNVCSWFQNRTRAVYGLHQATVAMSVHHFVITQLMQLHQATCRDLARCAVPAPYLLLFLSLRFTPQALKAEALLKRPAAAAAYLSAGRGAGGKGRWEVGIIWRVRSTGPPGTAAAGKKREGRKKGEKRR